MDRVDRPGGDGRGDAARRYWPGEGTAQTHARSAARQRATAATAHQTARESRRRCRRARSWRAHAPARPSETTPRLPAHAGFRQAVRRAGGRRRAAADADRGALLIVGSDAARVHAGPPIQLLNLVHVFLKRLPMTSVADRRYPPPVTYQGI